VCVFLSWIKERKKKFRKEARDCETVFQVRSPEDRHLYRCLNGTHYQNSATASSTEQQVPYSLVLQIYVCVSFFIFPNKKRRETHLPNAPASTKTRAIQKKPYSRKRESCASFSLSLVNCTHREKEGKKKKKKRSSE
jgi:hypothetical protein